MISVIIPVFNAEKYLDRCLKNIINQTYRDIEIIIIDDGSHDSSWKIIENNKNIDSRIVAVHQENKGVSSARNLGISLARGEFIVFVDADDFPKKNMCEILISHLSNDVDLVASGIKVIKKNYSYNQCHTQDLLIDKSNLSNVFNSLFALGTINTPFAKLFRKNNIINLFLEDSVLGEDLIFNLAYIDNMQQKIYISHESLYDYNSANEASATKRFREHDFAQIVKLYNSVNKFRLKNKILIEPGDSIDRRLFYDGIQYLNMAYLSDIEKKKKRYLLDLCIEDKTFARVCQYRYNTNIKYNFLGKMIIGKHKKLLNMYFIVYSQIKLLTQKLKG